MKAVTWHGRRDVRVDDVPDPTIEDPTDVIVRITSTAICGSDLHLYEVLRPVPRRGRHPRPRADGHRRGGRPGGHRARRGRPRRRPVQRLLRHCWMCDQGLHSQCETTQNRDQGTGASLFGYTKLYGQVPGGQAEFLRVPFGNTLPVKVPDGPPDERFLYLSDVLPTAWQAVEYADVPDGGTLVRARPRPDRRHGLPHRAAPGQARDRRRPGARAPRARARPAASRCSTSRARRRPRRRSCAR